MTTYTNLGITKIVTGDSAGAWGGITNTNFDFFDTAICGVGNIVAPATGSTSVPNNLPITDATASDGRNRVLNFTSASNLGGTVYYQITPDDFQGYYFVQNNLTGPQNLTIFQGTYDVTRALTISGDQDAVIKCDGTGVTSLVTAVLADMTFNSGAFNSLNVTAAPTVGTSVMNQTAVLAAITTAGSAGITFVSGNQILFRGAVVPTGWAVVAQNDKALRIVSGTPGSGGSYPFTTVFNGTIATQGTTLTSAQSGIRAHTHPFTVNNVQLAASPNRFDSGSYGGWNVITSNTANNIAQDAASPHTHPLSSNAVAYYDMQVIQKN